MIFGVRLGSQLGSQSYTKKQLRICSYIRGLMMALCSWNMLPWWYACILIIKWCVRMNYSHIYYTQRRTTGGRIPLDEWSGRRRDLYLTTHNTHNKQISMPPVRFKPTISAGDRPQTYALDRTATGSITVHTKACHQTLSWAQLIRTMLSHYNF